MVSAADAREQARQVNGQFGVQPRAEAGLPLDLDPDEVWDEHFEDMDDEEYALHITDPETLTPDEAFDVVCDPEVIDRYTLGDCAVLADAVARRNGWGVVVVGDLEVDDDDPDDVVYFVGSVIHAWARRPDGALVDIRGVWAPEVAERRAAEWGVPVHSYDTAEQHAAQWDPDQWGYDDVENETKEYAEHYAGFVSRFGAVYEPGHVEE